MRTEKREKTDLIPQCLGVHELVIVQYSFAHRDLRASDRRWKEEDLHAMKAFCCKPLHKILLHSQLHQQLFDLLSMIS